MKLQTLLRYRKDPRLVVAIPLLLFITISLVYYFIQQANELSPEALSNRLLLFVLWNINLILILGILFVLSRAAIKMLLERHRGILGSRFRTKLVLTYLATSIVPIVLLFIIANDLIRVSIDRWFNMPVQTVLANSERIAQFAQDEAIARSTRAASRIGAPADPRIGTTRELDELLRQHDLDVAGIYEDDMAVTLIAEPTAPIHEVREPSGEFFGDVRRDGRAAKIDIVPSGKWIRVGTLLDREANRIALTGVFFPAEISRMIDENIIAHSNFRQLDSQRSSLKAAQTSLFIMVTLYIVFGTIWTAIYVSRRITGPMQALTEGTRVLADGNYAHRIGVRATDEFGLLIDSFNSMADELERQRVALTDSNLELQSVNERLDEERAFLATLQESMSTGILSFDDDFRLLSINPAAKRILKVEKARPGDRIDQVFSDDLEPLREAIESVSEHVSLRPREVVVVRHGDLLYLEVSVSRLRSAAGDHGWVVAIENTTELVQAQKLAAWSEAARRIAHEIKNPLTPIQLSAERIARSFGQREGRDVEKVIDEGTTTIIQEVGQLKRMVDEFSRFARMPAVHLKQSSIETILEQAVALFREVKPGLEIRIEAEGDLTATVDPEQIRRAIVNLIDNAVAATDEGEIVVSAKRRDRSLMIEVRDTGQGVPDADKDRLFPPSFPTNNYGTGLGLALGHGIVHDHDGRITVHDNRPRGTIFEIEIPA
ncbi:MAG: ATP-binding protein [Thermoanaerobaculia bacterium]|nr:ATP-binding protein [Thermoanaerobaculia bacterium]